MHSHVDGSNVLIAARRIANHALDRGVLGVEITCRPIYTHIGAVLADSVLQAGLNYSNVVKPRVQSIYHRYPHATTTKRLVEIIENKGSSDFLQWNHREKVSRFDSLVQHFVDNRIDNTDELSEALVNQEFRGYIREIRGVGPKTVDYMACLVGADCIAVDRHIRYFAEMAGLKESNYDYLRNAFSFAADLLCVSRRDLDALIWQYQSVNTCKQMSLNYE